MGMVGWLIFERGKNDRITSAYSQIRIWGVWVGFGQNLGFVDRVYNSHYYTIIIIYLYNIYDNKVYTLGVWVGYRVDEEV